MERAVAGLFARYEHLVAEILAGRAGAGEFAPLYTDDVLGASPQGVAAGKARDFLGALAQGFERYRALGTRRMQVTGLRVVPIDAEHCLAHVGWSALYERDDLPPTTIAFEVHYLVRLHEGEARVFGWIAGDEEASLRKHGVM